MSTASFSQETNFGVKAGLNLSTVTGDVITGTEPRLAYHFGATSHFRLTDQLSINPELLYLSLGNKVDFSLENFNSIDPNPNFNNTIRYVERANFLALPININYHFTSRFSVGVGPQVSFLLNTKTIVKEQPDNVDTFNQTNPGNFRPDYGATLDMTYSPTEKLFFQLRYYQGLRNLINSELVPESKSFNVAVQLAAGYKLF